MIEGSAIAAALAQPDGDAVAERLIGSAFFTQASGDRSFRIVAVDRERDTVIVEATSGSRVDRDLRIGELEPTIAFAQFWGHRQREASRSSIAQRAFLERAGIARIADRDIAALVIRCMTRQTLPSISEGIHVFEMLDRDRHASAISAICAHWTCIAGHSYPFALATRAALAQRRVHDYRAALATLATSAPNDPSLSEDILLLTQRAALLMDLFEHESDAEALAGAEHCVARLETIAPGHGALLTKRLARLMLAAGRPAAPTTCRNEYM